MTSTGRPPADPIALALARLGLPSGPVLGSGVEGTVVDLGGDRVAKVWRHTSIAVVRRFADFHGAVTAAGPRLSTPVIEEVHDVDGVVVAASCFDMYGPRAREVEQILDSAVHAAFGHGAVRLAVYRAAYALVTATCFSPDGSDGHFAWCAAILARPEIREALG